MKIRLFLSALGFACLLSIAHSECDLLNKTSSPAFPDILKNVADSYIMGVEYTVPGANQTDYYTEYYEYQFKRGRLDGHQAGEKFQYIYRSETWEAWNLKGNKCELKNITVTPEFMKSDMTDWVHSSGTEQFTTIGPSAMFKVAFDDWKTQKGERTMAFMGQSKELIRGERAVSFRRCINDYAYADYYFAAKEEENADDDEHFQNNVTPLRVAFFNITGKLKEMAYQYYDIISFQHKIPSGVEPFELPKGRNCKRDIAVSGPLMPDFSGKSILLSAEVLYRKISIKNDENELKSSYYSTLMFALDREIHHIAYMYSAWNMTKRDEDHQEPFVNLPKYNVYDQFHKYIYTLNYDRDGCSISRDKGSSPVYILPENGGSLSLTNPYVLFPNNEFTYLTTGTDRGLKVNIYEAALKGFPLDAETQIPQMFASRSYLTDNEEVENTVGVKSPLTQAELHFFREKDVEEILTFNIYGFTTKLPQKRKLFDISPCFKNEDDYVYLTLGLETEERVLPELEKRLEDVEKNVLQLITLKSELNAVRIPYVMTDVKGSYILITMLILGKPPLQLDFNDAEENMTITVSSEDDTQGIGTFDICANNCLETKGGCWGFSICGNTCYYGTTTNVDVEKKDGCNLYRRYTNETYIQSKEVQVSNIVNQVAADQFMTTIILDSGEKVELKATIAQITNPAEDDELFTKMGNNLNNRMRVLKSGAKLKKGTTVKNLGKLRYDECQKLCLDFKDCESLSYCLLDGRCSLSTKMGADLKKGDQEEDNLCILLTRKYTDHFDRTPGVFVATDEGTKVNAATEEDCASACLKQDKFKCLSFDHCAGGEKDGCRLYKTHFLKGSGKSVDGKNARCGHYSRKFSVDFQKKDETRIVGGNFQVILNLTLEECAQRCIEVGNSGCFGYDFCQGDAMYATSCTLITSDPSRMKGTRSPICTNYLRRGAEYAPRPYTNSYAGGIGFLCFLIGGVVGAVVVFIIAYIRVNRR